MEGTVKWFDKKKGYGFISSQDSRDVFVHYTAFAQDGLKTLDEGQSVCFEIIQGEKGPRAQNVTVKNADPRVTQASDKP